MEEFAVGLLCREIRADDVRNVIDLLTRGFNRKRNHWIRAMQRLADHPTPTGWPRYGYVLESEGTLVGVVLLITTRVCINGQDSVRSNVSSWYVEPGFRSYGALLSLRATRRENTTFFNVSPAPHTWDLLRRQGFAQFAAGRTISIPALTRPPEAVHVKVIGSNTVPGPDLQNDELELLRRHEKYGCLSLICELPGERCPFVFGLQLRYSFVPVAHLVYCHDFGDFVRFAGAIGRFLLRHGYAFVIFDSNGPVQRIVGKHFGDRPRFRRGGDQVRLGDVAYSEQVLFGY